MICKLPDYWKSVARGRHFHVQAVAREPRDRAMARVEAEIQRLRGDLLDFKMFSNLSTNLIVELPGDGVLALVDLLAGLGWAVELEPERARLAEAGGARLEGTVQLTFPEGDGELVIPTPAVPG